MSTDAPTRSDLDALAERLLAAIEATDAERSVGWSDVAFNGMAIALFRAQYEFVAPYRTWVDHELLTRGRTVGDVVRWQDVPALPISTMRTMRVAAHDAGEDVAVFRSSGTTSAERAAHHLPRLDLYEASLRAGVRAALLPDRGDTGPLLAVQLVPTRTDLPESSLGHMYDVIRTTMADDGGVYADAGSRIDTGAAWEALTAAAASGRPVLLLATSFALVTLLDWAADREALRLPHGSRVVDTGGYKGRTRELTRDELVTLVGERLGVAPEWCENEYGMTELSSQAWLGTVARATGRTLPGSRAATDGTRWQVPWMRTRIVDPVTLAEVADGEEGLVVHHDLANAYSCAALRSEDFGVRVGRSWRLTGRAPGAALRGCSLRVEDVWTETDS